MTNTLMNALEEDIEIWLRAATGQQWLAYVDRCDIRGVGDKINAIRDLAQAVYSELAEMVHTTPSEVVWELHQTVAFHRKWDPIWLPTRWRPHSNASDLKPFMDTPHVRYWVAMTEAADLRDSHGLMADIAAKRRSISSRLRHDVIRRDSSHCQYCGCRTNRPFLDHLVPVAEGGLNQASNLVVACSRCNGAKCASPARLCECGRLTWHGRRSRSCIPCEWQIAFEWFSSEFAEELEYVDEPWEWSDKSEVRAG